MTSPAYYLAVYAPVAAMFTTISTASNGIVYLLSSASSTSSERSSVDDNSVNTSMLTPKKLQ